MFAIEDYPDLMQAEGLEEAIVGVINRLGTQALCYDLNKVIDILMRDMSEEEAWEYFYYNIEGCYVGENTPVYLTYL